MAEVEVTGLEEDAERAAEAATDAAVEVAEAVGEAVAAAVEPLAEAIGEALAAGAETAPPIEVVSPAPTEHHCEVSRADFDALAAEVAALAVVEEEDLPGVEAEVVLPDVPDDLDEGEQGDGAREFAWWDPRGWL